MSDAQVYEVFSHELDRYNANPTNLWVWRECERDLLCWMLRAGL